MVKVWAHQSVTQKGPCGLIRRPKVCDTLRMRLTHWIAGLLHGSRAGSSSDRTRAGKANALCSFCRKSYRDVGPLVEGPDDVFICGECLELCQSIFDQEHQRRSAKTVALRELAHGRSGDKGNHANIGVACYNEAGYRHVAGVLTADRVAEYFRDLGASRVVRYELPNLWSFNFVLYDALGGGASRSLRIDSQGKTLALQLLEMQIPAPERDSATVPSDGTVVSE